MMFWFRGGQRTPQIGGCIAFSASSHNGVAKDRTDILQYAMRGFERAAFFNPTQAAQ